LEGRPQMAGLLARFEEYPVASAVLIFAAMLALGLIVGAVATMVVPTQAQLPDFVTECVMVVVVVALITALGWWRTIGCNRPAEWRQLHLLWLPAILVLVLPFLKGARPVSAGMLAFWVAGYAMTGFREEALYRGVILRVLRPSGTVQAVLLSALLFGLNHANNFLFRNPFIVLAQIVGAICFGVAYAALRVRTNTIWFLMLLHGLHDLTLKLTAFPAIPLDVVQDVILLGYGLYLIRSHRVLEAAQPATGTPEEALPQEPRVAGS
jgi:membrane protease YdiL (CAAX protease family)